MLQWCSPAPLIVAPGEAQNDLPVQPLDNEKSVKFQLFRYCSAQSGFPMRASDNSVGGNADRVAKIQVGNRALIEDG
jgi:hypothetical protein